MPGDTCLVRAGTYNESLSIITSGTSGAIITLQNYNGETVTVNSGGSMTLQTTGHQSYYTIDGFRFISTISGGYDVKSIDFKNGWYTGEMDPNGGNGNITLRNCYVEGAVLFNGPNNTVENCEFNGRNVLDDAIHFRFAASKNGIVRNNIIHDYLARAVWADSIQDVNGILIQGNTVYNTYLGIDCDGANIASTGCKVIKNTVYNTGQNADHRGWGCSIFMENAFNSIIDGNLIYGSYAASAIYIVNYGNGVNNHTYNNTEYRGLNTNMVISNNVIYGHPNAETILLIAARGIQLYNNTFVSPSTWAPIIGVNSSVDSVANTWTPQNLTVRNNIFYGTNSAPAWTIDNANFYNGSIFSNNLYYGVGATIPDTSHVSGNPLFVSSTDFHLKSGSPAIDAGYNLGSLNTKDFDGNIRPKGAGYDIGAYEFPSP
jgi:hypothetical protein